MLNYWLRSLLLRQFQNIYSLSIWKSLFASWPSLARRESHHHQLGRGSWDRTWLGSSLLDTRSTSSPGHSRPASARPAPGSGRASRPSPGPRRRWTRSCARSRCVLEELESDSADAWILDDCWCRWGDGCWCDFHRITHWNKIKWKYKYQIDSSIAVE